MDSRSHRRSVLSKLGGQGETLDEVLHYCENPFELELEGDVFALPGAPEPHVTDWHRYLRESREGNVFSYLGARLPQLSIPIRRGVSSTEEYAAVMRRGEPFESESFGSRLELDQETSLRLLMHDHPAGALPVLTTSDRADFETLWHALACKSEPKPIGSSVNAQMIAGVLNWDRVCQYKKRWIAQQASITAVVEWPAELKRVAATQPELFHDRIVVVMQNPYSGVAASDLGIELDEDEWESRSMELRIEHELTHYATKRWGGAMQLNVLDELIADFMGITWALGSFHGAWFLRFMGMVSWPQVNPEGRVQTYCVGLSESAFPLLGALVIEAANGLERLGNRFYTNSHRVQFLLSLMQVTLETLAAEDAEDRFGAVYERTARLMPPGVETRKTVGEGDS